MPGPDPKWGDAAGGRRSAPVGSPSPTSTPRCAGCWCWPIASGLSARLRPPSHPAAGRSLRRRRTGPGGRRGGRRAGPQRRSPAAVRRESQPRRLLGPGARNARPLGGGSAIVFPPYLVMPLRRPGRRVGRVGPRWSPRAGTELTDGLRPVRVDELDHPGIDEVATVRWFGADGVLLGEEGVATALLVRAAPELRAGAVALEWSTRFVADADGEWQLGVSGFGTHQLDLDGVRVLDEHWPAPRRQPDGRLHRATATVGAGDNAPRAVG